MIPSISQAEERKGGEARRGDPHWAEEAAKEPEHTQGHTLCHSGRRRQQQEECEELLDTVRDHVLANWGKECMGRLYFTAARTQSTTKSGWG